MACKDIDRLLPAEDKSSEPEYGLVQRDQSSLLSCKRYAFITSVLLTLSVTLNALLLLSHATPFMTASHPDRSEYGLLLNSLYSQYAILTTLLANLEVDTTVTWEKQSDYSSDNMTLADERWKTLSADDGIVAMDREWAASKGLPPSEPIFPWDSSKSIYLLNGYHGIHCLVSSIHELDNPVLTSLEKAQLHLTLREYRDGLPQSHTFEHSNHCLDWLRGDVMCRADDTPLYTTRSMVPENGIGQSRQCRDWSKLETWARKHHSCYRYGDFVVEDKLPSQLGRFKYCPSDSPYLPAVRKHFGKGDDWFPVGP